ncbi:hypothetical protein CZ787_04655 [Halomonas citrativorans]|uniref:Uncharacterized protein n=1 Tax=Halomonas citrativorans TaxID=2742612 RepID=A0A1R4HUR1_9GAMM|nr:hypothetical protein CZ787_04655 [Halomonas citrativorans]
MKYQDHFPTIWDTPLKPSTKAVKNKAAKNRTAQPSLFKGIMLALRNMAKHKPVA